MYDKCNNSNLSYKSTMAPTNEHSNSVRKHDKRGGMFLCLPWVCSGNRLAGGSALCDIDEALGLFGVLHSFTF